MKVIKDKAALISKIEWAFYNFLNAYRDLKQEHAERLHQKLSTEKKWFFFKKHRNLPPATHENVFKLIEIAGEAPSDLVEMNNIGLTLQTIYRIAKKSENLVEFSFVLRRNEMELIDDWAKGKGSNEPSLPQ